MGADQNPGILLLKKSPKMNLRITYSGQDRRIKIAARYADPAFHTERGNGQFLVIIDQLLIPIKNILQLGDVFFLFAEGGIVKLDGRVVLFQQRVGHFVLQQGRFQIRIYLQDLAHLIFADGPIIGITDTHQITAILKTAEYLAGFLGEL